MGAGAAVGGVEGGGDRDLLDAPAVEVAVRGQEALDVAV